MVPLKCLSTFWRILEMPLINCETNIFNLVWKCIKVTRDYMDKANNKPRFEINNTNLVTLSIKDN